MKIETGQKYKITFNEKYRAYNLEPLPDGIYIIMLIGNYYFYTQDKDGFQDGGWTTEYYIFEPINKNTYFKVRLDLED